MDPFVLLAGTANPALAQAIAKHLGMPLGKCLSERFPDGEVSVQLLESVRHKAVDSDCGRCPRSSLSDH